MQLVAFVLRFWVASIGSTRQLLSMSSDCWNGETVSCSPVIRQHVSRWITFADFPDSRVMSDLRWGTLLMDAHGVIQSKIAIQAIDPWHGIVHRMRPKSTIICSITSWTLMEKCPKTCRLSVAVNVVGTLCEYFLFSSCISTTVFISSSISAGQGTLGLVIVVMLPVLSESSPFLPKNDETCCVWVSDWKKVASWLNIWGTI